MSSRPIQIPLNDLRRHVTPLAPELGRVVTDVIGSGRYILGDACAAFEVEFAAYCGAAHCLGVGNGTDAIELALRAAGLGTGARIATVANAGMYGTAAILAVGARPVFIDIEPTTLTMSPDALAAAGPVDAVIATHLYGRMADMPGLIRAAQGAAVFEDCAQAHGASLAGRRAGGWGLAGCFSFYPTKNLGALGDGGAVVTSDAGIAERVGRLRQHGWAERYRAVLPGGRNSRLDEIQAAILRTMLPHVDSWNRNRGRVATQYQARLAGSGIQLPQLEPAGAHVAHLYVLRTEQREALRAGLRRQGIGSDIHYPVADYRQPAVIAAIGDSGPLPETERAIADILTIPCFPELAEREVDIVAAAIIEALKA